MTNVDVALLTAEWTKVDDGPEYCPVCREGSCAGHEPGCALALALSERGFCTREERDAARGKLLASGDTEPPPS